MQTQNFKFIMQIFAMSVAIAGAYTDLTVRKIPNKLTMSATLLGFGSNLLFCGWNAFVNSVLGFLLGFSFILLWILGALKAGDVKLYMAIGAVGGWRFCLSVMFVSILLGGIVSFFILLIRKEGRIALKNVWNYIVNMFLLRKFYPYKPISESSYFSFGIYIAVGAVITIFMGSKNGFR